MKPMGQFWIEDNYIVSITYEPNKELPVLRMKKRSRTPKYIRELIDKVEQLEI